MRFFALIIVMLLALPAWSQSKLSTSIQYSSNTYVYKISVKETEILTLSKLEKVNEKFLHSLIDSFKTGSKLPKLNPGNYLLLHVAENRQVFKLHTAGDVGIQLVNNDKHVFIAVHSANGTIINDAIVHAGKKQLKFNNKTQVYGTTLNKNTKLIKVEYHGVLYVFDVGRDKDPYRYRYNYSRRTSLIKRIAYSFPLKYIVRPINKLFANLRDDDRYPNYFREQTDHEKKFKGFIAFSKPKYKPGDTVKLKAFIQTDKGKHLDYPLIVRLTGGEFSFDTVIATIHPYRAGGYEYQFVLSDSLDLDLDEEYLITLEHVSSKKYDLSEYEGDLDEDEYAMKRKVVMRGKFNYEEYELHEITFTARSSKREHHRGEELALYMKATDENEMAVMDGRVQITIRRTKGNNPKFNHPTVFIPDTLWSHSQTLDNLGETKIVVPDSVFPRANFDYDIEIDFLDASNELRQQELDQYFIDDPSDIVFEQKKDSLLITYLTAGRPTPFTAMLYGLNKNDTIEQRNISLPATIKMNPFATSYEIKAGDLSKIFNLKSSRALVTSLAMRTADSVIIQLSNPYHLPVWYTIFAAGKVIQRGYGDSLIYKARSQTSKNYSVSVQYVYAGKLYKDEYTIPYQDKLLTIKMDQPEFVYPGQTATIGINVTDSRGKPVSNADVTAYAYTLKFGSTPPAVPYMGKRYPYRIAPNYRFSTPEERKLDNSVKLNWERWSREMNLGAIEYYKFTHPKDLYISREPAADSITQIAPFVVSNGDIQPIHCLYINGTPYFFSQSQQLRRYSFKVKQGWNYLRFRTHNKEIIADSVFVQKGMKTFLSVNADSASRHVLIKNMPDTLDRHEQQLWNRYMIMVENNFGENLAYVRQGDQVFLLNGDERRNSVLIGPTNDYAAALVVKNKFEQAFEPEGGWQFNIAKGLIKQRQLRNPLLFSTKLSEHAPTYNFYDLVLTAQEIDSLWQQYLDLRSSNTELFYQEKTGGFRAGEVIIGLESKPINNPLFVKNVILFRYGNPDFIRIYTGNSRHLGYVQPAMYRLLFLLKDGKYFIRDSIQVLSNGLNYFEIQPGIVKPRDSVSTRITSIIENRIRGDWYSTGSDMDRIKQTFNNAYMGNAEFSELIGGIVVDAKDGTPLAGVAVMVKGTNRGTVTNARGEFKLLTPPQATIVASWVGYETREMKVDPGRTLHIFELHTAERHLQEVVVVGFGTVKKREVMSSASVVNALQGKVAGVYIRGNSTAESRPPLIIIDGVPFNGDMSQLDTSKIANLSVMDETTATALYGSRAANGVIIITTKAKALQGGFDEPMPFNAIRRHFRDDAYWQPRLSTDANGNASFTVTFPDDITNWKTHVIAMGDKKQTGYYETSVKSFKAVSGNVVLPQFTIEGDSINVIGKTLNYLPDSIRVKRSFSVNDLLFKENIVTVRNALIDTFAIVGTGKDSLKVKYTIQQDNGYADGEERSIPIFKAGTLETAGMFASLNTDTTFEVAPRHDKATMKLYAESSLLPVWYAEAESIRHYEYLCNEQLASKLKAMLVMKRIDEYYKRPFTGEKNILDLISRLNQNKSKSGLWDWWRSDNHTMWISLHVVEALAEAGSMGYTVNLNKVWITDYLVFNLESSKGYDQISSLFLLHLLDAKVDYKRYIDTIEKRMPRSRDQFEKLRLTELKQKVGLPVMLDTLIAKRSQTVFGNVYWGEESYYFFENSIQITLAMYRILRNAGGHQDLLRRIRNYFLEKRKDGNWRNTFESALILQTILPDLLAEDPLNRPTSLTISGKENIMVQKFPFYTELKSGEKISVTKSGAMPVYFTAFERYWNESPEKINGNFIVQSTFKVNSQTVSRLKAGEPVQLRVVVDVKDFAEYVMVEVPIPAGCSYYDKSQSWVNNEVHREHFKDKVSIFCRSLYKGRHEFTVSLLPRFSGVYTLNPAKAEMMYFPVFVGREGMKRVRID